MNNIRETRGAH